MISKPSPSVSLGSSTNILFPSNSSIKSNFTLSEYSKLSGMVFSSLASNVAEASICLKNGYLSALPTTPLFLTPAKI